MKSLRVALMIVLVLAAAVPAGATPPSDSPGAARRSEAAAWAAAASGSLAEVVSAAGGASAPAPAGGDPITTLSQAVSSATRLVNGVVPTGISGRHARMRTRRAAQTGSAPRDLLDADAHAALDRAAAIVAAAIDTALPRLAAASPAPAPAGVVDGCELVDQAPALCVAGTGANVITKDYALVVDLGGADLHANSAGGADPLGNGLPVAVTIDVGGDDRYDAPVPTASGSWVSQGGGYLAGVGFLVDAAGNDTYRIAATGGMPLAMGQGKAESGYGVLADLAGNDTYELTATGAGWTSALGQADGANGVAVLLDREGNDQHVVRATGNDVFQGFGIIPPVAAAVGLGTGRNGYIVIATPPPVHVDAVFAGRGYGLFADGGGSDTVGVEAVAVDPGKDEVYGPFLVGLPGAVSYGLGVGQDGGVGLALFGDGATDASVTAAATAPGSQTLAQGFGVGSSLGIGAVSDLGGADTRRLAAGNAVTRQALAEAGCACAAPVVDTGMRAATVIGMGYGEFVGTGLLSDAGTGSDTYVASSTNTAEAVVRDERPGGEGTGFASATVGTVTAEVQGVGRDFGIGELVDTGGNDRYEVTAGSSATATATRADGAPQPEAAASAGDSAILAQAAARSLGSGTLTDLGGNDAYLTTSTAAAGADPPTVVVSGGRSASVLASVDQGSSAAFLDADGGAADQFVASPAGAAACTGTRGQGTWLDCGGAGAGAMT